MMQDYLQETDLFAEDIRYMDSVWLVLKYKESRPEPYTMFIHRYPDRDASYAISHDPKTISDFVVDFDKYDLVVTNLRFEASLWPETTRTSFEKCVKNWGGLVVVHTANNAWGNWKE